MEKLLNKAYVIPCKKRERRGLAYRRREGDEVREGRAAFYTHAAVGKLIIRIYEDMKGMNEVKMDG